MQDKYAGDFGDFVKFSLLRAVSQGKSLGVAWYAFPNEDGKNDGKHVKYLREPERWKHLDPEVYEALRKVVEGPRVIHALENASILPGARFANELLRHDAPAYAEREIWRKQWFERTLGNLKDCQIVFADPDNGLRTDENWRAGKKKHWKSIPLREVGALAENRTAIIYHHNQPFRLRRISNESWRQSLLNFSKRVVAVYCGKYGKRTFFVINPSSEIDDQLKKFSEQWPVELTG